MRGAMSAAADPEVPGQEAPPAATVAPTAATDGHNINMNIGTTDGTNVPPVAATDEHVEDAGENDDDTSEGGAGSADTARAQKKRKERLEQNRISARESRKRKKTMIEELQRTVITLSKENKDLNERNEQLRSQLVEIGRKYPNVVSIQAIMNGAPPPAPQPPPAIAQQQQQAGFTSPSMALFSSLPVVQQQGAVATPVPAATVTKSEAINPTAPES